MVPLEDRSENRWGAVGCFLGLNARTDWDRSVEPCPTWDRVDVACLLCLSCGCAVSLAAQPRGQVGKDLKRRRSLPRSGRQVHWNKGNEGMAQRVFLSHRRSDSVDQAIAVKIVFWSRSCSMSSSSLLQNGSYRWSVV